MRYIYSSLLMLAFFLLLSLVPALAQETSGNEPDPDEENPDPFYHRDEPMKFHLASWGGSHFTYYWISAQGMITKDTPKAFINFLRHDRDYHEALKEIAYTTKLMQDPKYQKAIEDGDANPITTELYPIQIHSCGGDERAAMELGKIAKAHDLTFFIGQTYPDPYGSPPFYSTNGECIGACLFTAMGKPFASSRELNPTLATEQELEHVQRTEENYGNMGIDVYPLHDFQTPHDEIRSYAGEMGIDFLWLEQLLPQNPMKVRYLTNLAALGLGLRAGFFVGGDNPLPPSENQPCRDSERLRKR